MSLLLWLNTLHFYKYQGPVREKLGATTIRKLMNATGLNPLFRTPVREFSSQSVGDATASPQFPLHQNSPPRKFLDLF